MKIKTSIFIVVLLSILFLSKTVRASKNIGTITKLIGKATMLLPHTTEAVTARLGDKVKEDTSIKTYGKSFVRITLINKVKMNLGPNSKMVVNLAEKRKTGVVSLLLGKMRSNTAKKVKSEKKDLLLIKTKTAALGVRGTDFQTAYNPQNEVTSILTYEGKVAMVAVDKEHGKLSGAKDIKKIKSILKDEKRTVVIKRGYFSSVRKNLKKATVPVRISPVQYTKLKLAKDFGIKDKISDKRYQKEMVKVKKDFAILAKDEKTKKIEASSTYNRKKGEFKPKAGGLVDFETGLYIPPSEKSKYDKKLHLFSDKDEKKYVGKVGDYIPPNGMKLDAARGFVKKHEVEKVDRSKLEELNKRIKGQINKVKPKKKWMKPTEDDLDGLNKNVYDEYYQ